MEIVEGNSDEESSLPTLNYDVLENIFEFLPTSDRKNAKLVCKQWLEVLSQKRFTQNEAFFLPHFYDYQTIMKGVDKCCRNEPMNLRFDRHHFYKKSQILWQKCGSKIGSLNFNRCSFYPDMLRHIITYCDNLKHLRIEKCEIFSHPKSRLVQKLSFPTECPYRRLIHKNLTSLDVYEGLSLNLSNLMFIASVFPQLETLKIFLDCSSNAKTDKFSAAVEILQRRFHQLTSLCVKFEFGNDKESYFPKDFSRLSPANFNRLKDTSFSVYAPCLNLMESMESIFRHECWSAITIGTKMMLNSGSVVRMLDENLFLEKLDIDFWINDENDVPDFCIIFAALVRSSLKELRFRIGLVQRSYWDHVLFGRRRIDINFQLAYSLLENLPQNYTLLHLNMSFDSHTKRFRPLFFEYFPNVRSLSTDSMMAADTRFHEFLGLEFLEIEDVPIQELLNFHLPNLIYLTCGNDRLSTSQSYLDLPKLFPQKFPNLRGIEIRWCNRYGWIDLEKLDVIFQSFQNCHQLRYISFDSQPVDLKIQEDQWESIISSCLDHCPSLKALSFTNGYLRHHYFYDVSDKKFRPFEHSNNRSLILESLFCGDRMSFQSYWLNKR